MARDKTDPPIEPIGPTKDWRKSFRINRVYDSYASRAARSAVMRPILHVAGEKRSAEKDFSALRLCWYNRVLALKEAGWKILRSDKDAGFMMNCPPFSVKTGTKAIPCGRTSVCPFCYARYWVIRPFRAAEKVLFGCVGKPKQVPEPIRPDLRVVWFRSVYGVLATVRSGAQLTWTPGNLPWHVAAAYTSVRLHRKEAINVFGAEAGCLNTHPYRI